MYGLSPLRFVTPSYVASSLGANDPKVGDVAHVGNEMYVFVYNDGNTPIKVGDGVIVSSVSGYSVTISSTTGVELLVGVNKHATISSAQYGYICVRGWSQVNMGADLSCAAGAGLVLAADGKFTAKTCATGYAGPIQVIAMEAIASAASGTAYIAAW